MKKVQYDMSKLKPIDESGYLPKKIADKYNKKAKKGKKDGK